MSNLLRLLDSPSSELGQPRSSWAPAHGLVLLDSASFAVLIQTRVRMDSLSLHSEIKRKGTFAGTPSFYLMLRLLDSNQGPTRYIYPKIT